MPRTCDLDVSLIVSATERADATTAPAAQSGQNQIVFDQYSQQISLRSSGTTPTTHGDVIDLSTSIGAAPTDHDLTAALLARENTRTTDLTGKKLLTWIISTPIANAGDVTIAPGASNGYDLFGALGLHVLPPGNTIAGSVRASGTIGPPAVDATHKIITVSGTNGDTVQIELIFGT